jgi:hypothetical protein
MSSSLSKFAQDLRRLPRVVAQQITAKAAPAITALGQTTFDASQNAYGVPWQAGADGARVTLRKSGRLARYIHYVAIGTKLRVALGVPYAKYQIGRRPVFPTQGKALPPEYVRTLEKIAIDGVRSNLRGGS